jgi:predicted ABC-type ATPase
MTAKKRLRIVAGPNGSGKSTIIGIVREEGIDLGIYVNADDIKKEFDSLGLVNFDYYDVQVHEKEIEEVLLASSFFDVTIRKELLKVIRVVNNSLYCENANMFDFISTFTADFLRFKLLGFAPKFTFETVMSHPSKLDFIQQARSLDYKTYLYFVSLEDPELNKDRVLARVQQHGHDVPQDKIVSRYYRTMDMLFDAIKIVDKAYFFDNSSTQPEFFAKYENGEIVIILPEHIPQWFHTYVIDKITTTMLF